MIKWEVLSLDQANDKCMCVDVGLKASNSYQDFQNTDIAIKSPSNFAS